MNIECIAERIIHNQGVMKPCYETDPGNKIVDNVFEMLKEGGDEK